MIFDQLRKPVIATFVWAFGINFILWFCVNVIWIGLEDTNILERTFRSYSYAQGIATGVIAPLFIGFLTSGLAYIFPRIRSRLAENSVIRKLVLSGIVVLYLPISLLGLAGIIYVS